jgi:hypothetical protein
MSRNIRYAVVLLVVLMGVAAVQVAGAAANPNPGIVPNTGDRYGQLGAQWWQWALSFPKADVPYMQPSGPVDISAHQSSNVWFLAGAGWGVSPVERSGQVPAGKYLFTPIANYINDYPCPDPGFQPEKGESLKAFLTRTGQVPPLTDLAATLDGQPITNLDAYKATSNLFWFQADPAMAEFDPCITGEPQRAVTDGYWLLLAPLTPGEHTLHFQTTSWGQDVTYDLTVLP